MPTHIQIADVSPRISYDVGGSVQSVFVVPFAFFDDDDLNVYVDEELLDASEYTVAGAGTFEEGERTVTLDTGVTNATVAIVRDITIERTTDFPNSGPLQVSALNTVLDKIIAILQELATKFERALVLDEADTDGSGSYDANGNSLENLGAATTDDGAARMSDLQGLAAQEGNVSPPLLGQVGYFLKATADGVFAWAALAVANISDFTESVDDRVAALLTATGLVVETYDDVGNSLGLSVAAASQAEALAGTATDKVMTPERTKQVLDAALLTGAVVGSKSSTYATNASLTTQIPLDDTIPQVGEGTEIISTTYTPRATTTKIRVRFKGSFALSGAGSGVAALFVNGAADAVAVDWLTVVNNDAGSSLTFEYEHTPGVTTAQTYSVRVGPGSAITMRMNGTSSARRFGGAMKSILVIEELIP